MLRQIIIPILIIATLILAYMGTVVPIKKASMYIETNSRTQSFGSVSELKQEFDKVFDYSSPIGQREISKFLMTNILSIIQNQPEDIGEELTKYAESKIMEGDFIHNLRVANMYNALWQKFGDQEYFNKAEKYYLEAHELGPKVPQPMHNLYIIYRDSGMTEKKEEMADKIFDLWPSYADSTENGELQL